MGAGQGGQDDRSGGARQLGAGLRRVGAGIARVARVRGSKGLATDLQELRDRLTARLGEGFVVRLVDRPAQGPVPRGGAIVVFDMHAAPGGGHGIDVQLPDGARLSPVDPAFAELPLPLQQLDARCVAIVSRARDDRHALRVTRLERRGASTVTQGRTVPLGRDSAVMAAEAVARLIDEEVP